MKDDTCMFVLLSPYTCEEGLPSIDSVSVTGKIKKGTSSYDALLKNLSDESLFDLLRSFQITEIKDYYFPNFENNQMQQDIQKLFNVNISNEIMKKAYLTKEFKKSFSK